MQLSRTMVVEIIDSIRRHIKNDSDISKLFQLDSEIDGRDLIYGVSNGFLAQLIETITGITVEVRGEVESLYECPCCKYKTLTEKYDAMEGTGYDICPYCGWEDDGTIDIEIIRSINNGSIKEYRNRIETDKDTYYINKWLK